MLKTIELTLDESLLAQIEQATRTLGIPRSQFIQQAIRRALPGSTPEQTGTATSRRISSAARTAGRV